MKKLILIAAMLFCSLAQANSIADWFKTKTVEVTKGWNFYQITPNGLYYQVHTRDDVPYQFDLTTHAWALGVSDYITRGTTTAWYDRGHDGIKWRVEYLDSGTVSSMAKGTSDTNYDAANQTCVVQPCDLNGHFSTWSVQSRHRGFVTSVAPEWAVGPGKLSVEAGVYWGFPEVIVRIDRPAGVPNDVYKYQGGLNAGGVLGLGYQYKSLTLFARYIHMDAVNDVKGVFEKDLPPNHNPGATQVGARVSF